MNTLLAPLSEIGEFEDLQKQLNKKNGCVAVTGCMESQKLHVASGLSEGSYQNRLFITYSDQRIKELLEDEQLYDREAVVFPSRDLIFYQADIHGNQLTKERIKTLRRILEGKPTTVITTFSSLMAPQLSPDIWRQYILSMDEQTTVDEKALSKKLVEMGYEKTYQVEAPGQFSVRGGIVDIFDLTEENPYRIELWGDEIESIRSFDVMSQRSIEKLTDITIYPATEMLLTGKQLKDGLDRIKKDAAAFEQKLREEFHTEEAHRVAVHMKELEEQITELGNSASLMDI